MVEVVTKFAFVALKKMDQILLGITIFILELKINHSCLHLTTLEPLAAPGGFRDDQTVDLYVNHPNNFSPLNQ